MSCAADQVRKAIGEYLSVLENRGVPVQSAYLFGSQAKGTAGPYSDIDLIVVSTVFQGMPLWKRWEVLGDALAAVMEPIEARGYSPDEIDRARTRQASFVHAIFTDPETVECSRGKGGWGV